MSTDPYVLARELADAVLRQTDWLFDNRAHTLDSEATSHLLSVRIRAREVLEHLPSLSEAEAQRRALLIERWGSIASTRRRRRN